MLVSRDEGAEELNDLLKDNGLEIMYSKEIGVISTRDITTLKYRAHLPFLRKRAGGNTKLVIGMSKEPAHSFRKWGDMPSQPQALGMLRAIRASRTVI